MGEYFLYIRKSQIGCESLDLQAYLAFFVYGKGRQFMICLCFYEFYVWQ